MPVPDKGKSNVDIPSRSRSITVLHGLCEDGNTLVHPHVTGLLDHQASDDSANELDPSSTRDGVQEQDEITSAPNVSATHESQLSESGQVESSCAVGGADQDDAMPSGCLAPDHSEVVDQPEVIEQ
ncbi:hypothetical protein V6N11_031659 [Hibiscus sabdariffa]|uniref:Uncharacterized protein n=1 Tax=Hibiscus sabdariffa TaxID=183260 RepID=A0ABR2SZ19_9ROSI